MQFKRLFLWVEGDDDIRFFNSIIKPSLETKYDSVDVKEYSHLKKGKIVSFIKSIKGMNADYIFVRDLHNTPCVTKKKQEIKQSYRNIATDRIAIVRKEIEGWYLAGLGNNESKSLRIKNLGSTDDITKQQFDRLIPKRFDSRIDFMLEILNHFSIVIGKNKNRSFKYFIEKYDC